MGFLDKVRTTVQQGAVKAATATERTLKLAQLSGELSAKRQELDKLYAKLGADIHLLGRQERQAEIPGVAEAFLVEAQAVSAEVDRLGDLIDRVRTSEAAQSTSGGGGGTCAACGAAVAAGSKFCPGCGQKFG